MKKLILLLAILVSANQIIAQSKYYTKKGKVSFYSETSVENIEAHNNRAVSVFEPTTGKLEFSVLISAFEFKKALMQEHFNENYMESHKFPKSTFVGKITNMSEINVTKDGSYTAKVEGDLTIHGVTKPISVNGKINVKGGKVSAYSEFEVAVKDYDIKIPSAVAANISEIIKIVVNINYEPLKK